MYYGTEAVCTTRVEESATTATGRLTFVLAGRGTKFGEVRQSASFQSIAAINDLRRKLPALISGAVSPLWTDSDSADADDGVFAFARGEGSDGVIVVCNASDRERVTGVPGSAMKLVSRTGQPLLRRGEKLARIFIAGLDVAPVAAPLPIEVAWRDDLPQAELRIAPESLHLYRIVP